MKILKGWRTQVLLRVSIMAVILVFVVATLVGTSLFISQGSPPMIMEEFAPCDNDRDGDCDADDFELVTKAIGQCISGDNYDRLADADRDDCVTVTDQQQLFPVIPVRIDIKPGSFPNSIDPTSTGVIPVAILTKLSFDATTVDSLSVRFGPSGAREVHNRGHIEDVNGDGKLDLVLHFDTQQSGIKVGDTQACLTGKTKSGLDIQGCDQIRTIQ